MAGERQGQEDAFLVAVRHLEVGILLEVFLLLVALVAYLSEI